jgi:hypothetical protein
VVDGLELTDAPFDVTGVFEVIYELRTEMLRPSS